MKKAISLILVIFMFVTCIASLSSCEMFEDLLDKDEKKEGSGFAGGQGTEEDPYIISSAKHLKNLAKKINDSETYEEYTDKYYKMTQDIDLGGEEWTPICNGDNPNLFFKGVFDGDGYKVSNFKITDNSFLNNGLFGEVSGTIKNLNVSQFEINFTEDSARGKYVGGIVAQLGGDAPSLENCSAEGRINVVSNGILTVGGVLGRTYAYDDYEKVIVKNCSSMVFVTAESTIENADYESIGLVCGSFAGGFGRAKVTNCSTFANVKATSRTHGSIVGVFTGSSGESIIQDCFAKGDAEMIRLAQDKIQDYRAGYLGGLCGDASYSNLKIERCFFDGDLKAFGVGHFYLGGISGAMDGSITNSFAIGTIDLNGDGILSSYNANGAYVGGLVGIAADKLEITNSYAANQLIAFYTENNMSIGGLVGGTRSVVDKYILLKNCISASNITADCTVISTNLPNTTDLLKISALIGEYPYTEWINNSYLTEGQTILGTYNAEICQDTELDKSFPVVENSSLSSSYFYMNTLSWDRNVWDLSNLNPYSGKYPTLLNRQQGN